MIFTVWSNCKETRFLTTAQTRRKKAKFKPQPKRKSSCEDQEKKEKFKRNADKKQE